MPDDEQPHGVFFNLHPAQAHGNDAKMGIERVWRNGNRLLVPAIGIQKLTLAVSGDEHLVKDAFRRDEHQRDIQSPFVWNDVFSRNGIRVSFDRYGKGAPRIVTLGSDPAVGIQRELGIDGHYFLVAKFNHHVRCLAARKAVLRGVLIGREGIFQQSLQRNFAQRASRFRSSCRCTRSRWEPRPCCSGNCRRRLRRRQRCWGSCETRSVRDWAAFGFES